jgi:hypothetical protein
MKWGIKQIHLNRKWVEERLKTPFVIREKE